jgi:hypothetical protein
MTLAQSAPTTVSAHSAPPSRARSATAPPRLRPAPNFQRILGDAARHKALAHRAYKSARQAAPIPPTLIDRLWTNALLAAEIAPPVVAARMFRRSETLLRLLVDQHNWKRP